MVFFKQKVYYMIKFQKNIEKEGEYGADTSKVI